jgi:hypothetical protein
MKKWQIISAAGSGSVQLKPAGRESRRAARQAWERSPRHQDPLPGRVCFLLLSRLTDPHILRHAGLPQQES